MGTPARRAEPPPRSRDPPRPPRSFDNSQICSGGADKAVALWDVTTGQVVRKYRGHAGVRRERGAAWGGGFGILPGGRGTDSLLLPQKVNCVQFNEEATVIVSGEGVAWGRPCKPRDPPAPPFPTLIPLFFPPNPSFPPGSIDSTVRCWDCRSRRPDPIQVLDEAKDGISSVKLSAHEILTG